MNAGTRLAPSNGSARDFELEPESRLGDAVRFVARAELERARRTLIEEPDIADRAVHEFRTSCKRVRGLLRLVQKELGSAYRHENSALRDAARLFSDVRDAASLEQAFAKIADLHRESTQQRANAQVALEAVASVLAEHHSKTLNALHLGQQRTSAIELIDGCLAQLEEWSVDGGVKTLKRGAGKTYARARAAMQRASETDTGADFHEWRKRVKYHRDQLRLLRPAWRKLLKPQYSAVKKLASLLGDEHDLQVLAQMLCENPKLQLDAKLQSELLGSISQRRLELQRAAFELGRRSFAEKPSDFAKRIAAYWYAATQEAA